MDQVDEKICVLHLVFGAGQWFGRWRIHDGDRFVERASLSPLLFNLVVESLLLLVDQFEDN